MRACGYYASTMVTKPSSLTNKLSEMHQILVKWGPVVTMYIYMHQYHQTFSSNQSRPIRSKRCKASAHVASLPQYKDRTLGNETSTHATIINLHGSQQNSISMITYKYTYMQLA